MSHVADRFVVVLDANVLWPFRTRDALLRFGAAGLFRPRWSEAILDEWVRTLIGAKPHLEESVRSQRFAMARAFEEGLVEGWEPLVDGIDLPDPNDRHVVAAAIRAGAEHIVTENVRDFPSATLEPLGIEAVRADDFLAATFELYPAEAVGALRTMRKAYRNPSMASLDFVFDLQKSGLPKLASLAKEHVDVL
ncbi:PIN domain-containing protein [Parvularcula oceani]|uniref:PIN domain-containing protein n=1 Tax=Parvularcula oceani TaxID=1247963 RepID=UPI0004E15F05|nr:PIN domain-containing protein [Parvularcula oceani]